MEEATRFNCERERDISKRMAALDASTAALLERVESKQHQINPREHSNQRRLGSNQIGGHLLGRGGKGVFRK